MDADLSEENRQILINQDILDDIALRDKIGEKYLDVSIKSIEQMRRWVFEVITISSAILGVFVLIGSSNSIIKNMTPMLVSLFFLAVVIIYGISHLKTSIEHDINELPNQAERLRKIQNEVIEAKKVFYNNMNLENSDKVRSVMDSNSKKLDERVRQPIKKDYSSDIIVVLFSLALVSLLFSMIDFTYMFGFFSNSFSAKGALLTMNEFGILSILFTLIGSYYLVKGNFKSIDDIVHESATYWGSNYALRKSMITQKINSIVGFIMLFTGVIFQLLTLSGISLSFLMVNIWFAILTLVVVAISLSELFIKVFNRKQIVASSKTLLREYGAEHNYLLFEALKKYCGDQEDSIVSLMANFFLFQKREKEDYPAFLLRAEEYLNNLWAV